MSFYLAATDDSSSARNSPIHEEKFNVPLSGDEHKDLFNFVRHSKSFTGLPEIAKSIKGPRRKPGGHDCQSPKARVQDDRSRFHIVLFFHTEVQKAISFCRRHILFLLAFVEIRLFKVFFSGKKCGIRETDKKRAGCGILAKKGRECGIRTPLSSNSVWIL